MSLFQKSLIFFLLLIGSQRVFAQVNENKLGIWYMYAFNADLNNSLWGFQGDIQHRNWNISNDLEQLLLRGGVHYTPKDTRLKITAGYAYIKSSFYGSDDTQNHENRIYQEVRFPHKIGSRFYMSHRIRFEQRIIQNQDFRTRFRYALGLDLALNNRLMIPKTWFISAYDEIFINGQKDTGNNVEVDILDRNRAYIGLGYIFSSHIKSTIGLLHQSTSNWSKNQFVVSLIHTI